MDQLGAPQGVLRLRVSGVGAFVDTDHVLLRESSPPTKRACSAVRVELLDVRGLNPVFCWVVFASVTVSVETKLCGTLSAPDQKFTPMASFDHSDVVFSLPAPGSRESRKAMVIKVFGQPVGDDPGDLWSRRCFMECWYDRHVDHGLLTVEFREIAEDGAWRRLACLLCSHA